MGSRSMMATLALVFAAACTRTEKATDSVPAAPVASEATPTPVPKADLDALGSLDFAEVVGKFDYRSQHLVWVLPEGVSAQGPWTANVEIKRDGEKVYEQSIPLTATTLEAGGRPEYPAGAVVIQLSADETWPTRYQEILGVVEDIKAQFGPGHGEATFSSDIKPKIDAAHHQAYCVEQKLPLISIYLEQGDPPTLQSLDMGGAGDVFRSVILAACPH